MTTLAIWLGKSVTFRDGFCIGEVGQYWCVRARSCDLVRGSVVGLVVLFFGGRSSRSSRG